MFFTVIDRLPWSSFQPLTVSENNVQRAHRKKWFTTTLQTAACEAVKLSGSKLRRQLNATSTDVSCRKCQTICGNPSADFEPLQLDQQTTILHFKQYNMRELISWTEQLHQSVERPHFLIALHPTCGTFLSFTNLVLQDIDHSAPTDSVN